MGNNPSSQRNNSGGSNPQSPATSSHQSASANHGHTSSKKEPRRRESIQALTGKATVAPPSASLESATASIEGRTFPYHQRLRSQTTTPLLQPTDESEAMGNNQSLQKTATAPLEVPVPSTANHPPAEASKPLDVPGGLPETHNRRHVPSPIDAEATLDDDSSYHLPPSNYSRPPRLPLPIEEEIHTPGSPIISPEDVTVPSEPIEANGTIPRRNSVLSTTTIDDDDDLDSDFPSSNIVGPKVPTIIEWKGKNEKVYVTGTFAGWDRKYRLHRNGPSKDRDCLSATLQLPPGTHHIKFIVDGDMRTSDHLPTAVDYTNILVNYLEISPDDIPQPAQTTKEPPRKEPVIPTGLHPPQVLPSEPVAAPTQRAPSPIAVSKQPQPSTPKGPSRKYHSKIPQFLLDMDALEDDPRYHRSIAALATQPAPPSLPLMLSKSILNGSTPVKDDASVLIMPNHTVLNHLATSSIKDNVLATSGTTRYKRKFLTTIMYKPTSERGD
ncbi:MAG: hypothetical protein M1820_000193 [Bogoriella megaspora]|nr:MAG: hypothetical protein M1820_000193 [Bogoriella megaspora]